ncbi:hypothetical protein [Dactylosporangium matsuzakiense]|uniref:hypothetical protein n=1 Tax=Dactylosporangium matsuzakiense TaxID=53360 RepID=UPI0021C365F2|nr:hypothetical protein [Dactylosporangium matsuzakiense]UWZ47551.1 hypothetical protein Dmats_14760 [Dactylosporangium matsuzakiense]
MASFLIGGQPATSNMIVDVRPRAGRRRGSGSAGSGCAAPTDGRVSPLRSATRRTSGLTTWS